MYLCVILIQYNTIMWYTICNINTILIQWQYNTMTNAMYNVQYK